MLIAEAPAAVARASRARGPLRPRPGGRPGASASRAATRPRRIVHAGGAQTGRAITGRLAELVAADDRGSRCSRRPRRSPCGATASAAPACVTDAGAIAAPATVLATGGGAALWRRTTNPWGAIGAGAVLAHAAGADARRPGVLPVPPHRAGAARHRARRHACSPRRSAARARAARRVGPAIHRRACPSRPGDGGDPRPDRGRRLRPRRPRPARRSIPERFPNVFAACRAAGLDPRARAGPGRPRRPLPDGRRRLRPRRRARRFRACYAVGECACSGVHGANRLASNSLSECFVFGARAAAAAAAATAGRCSGCRCRSGASSRRRPDTREAVWRRAGPRRDAARLEPLLDDPYPLARLIAGAALDRRESRGPHRRTDHPLRDPALDGVHLVIEADESLAAQRWP